MQFYVDVDNTICKTEGLAYEDATPYPDRIAKINELYDSGHIITIYTARGSRSCLRNYIRDLTAQQLREWGVRYHYLSVGEKPVYDYLIDDRNISLDQLDSNYLHEHFCSSQ